MIAHPISEQRDLRLTMCSAPVDQSQTAGDSGADLDQIQVQCGSDPFLSQLPVDWLRPSAHASPSAFGNASSFLCLALPSTLKTAFSVTEKLYYFSLRLKKKRLVCIVVWTGKTESFRNNDVLLPLRW